MQIIACFLALLLLFASTASAAAYLPRLYEHSQILFWEKIAKGVDSEDFKFVIAADPHNVYPRFTNLLKAAQADGALFVLLVGDFTVFGEKAEFVQLLNEIYSQVPNLPVFPVIGNHDLLNMEMPSPESYADKVSTPAKRKAAYANYIRYVGPADYVLDSPELGLKIVSADSATYVIDNPTLQWAREQLTDRQRSTFFATHMPPKWENWEFSVGKGSAEMIAVIKQTQPDGAFFGHIHTYDHKQIFNVQSFIAGVAGCSNIDWDIGEPGFGYLMCHVVNGVPNYSRVDLVTKAVFKSANY
ncbi:MAG: metallophosphoesterase [Negativicutes bacterium]|jgi:Icc-related predicted phosphoesterase